MSRAMPEKAGWSPQPKKKPKLAILKEYVVRSGIELAEVDLYNRFRGESKGEVRVRASEFEKADEEIDEDSTSRKTRWRKRQRIQKLN